MRVQTILIGAGLAVALAGAAHAANPRIVLAPGQPVCMDRQSLVTLMTSDPDRDLPRAPCKLSKGGTPAEVLSREPSPLPDMRVTRVKVTLPGQPPMVGYTVEVDPR